ncbi:divalent-cation tolerance protein CutA [Aliidiomarina minuta]|uniref:Divalent-cation tolerance protein CutA n=1 Tax=Aliidiomarina minuta TaxID=880057 RepID=A0A432W442_9GAMM|nr:divalent-cation tolerance protein CutA [Aliidiomarina minuta]RUO24101.1 divalent-cation tolerance protein CutA [Aliidiomarina minuta]
MSSDTQLVLCTVPDQDTASQLARLVVEQKLAACVNIVPQLVSVYEWEGKIEQDNEVLLLIKTQAPCFEALQNLLQQAHPYDVPEIIALDINAGLPAYLNWIKDVTEN